jgi:hypothetical protein
MPWFKPRQLGNSEAIIALFYQLEKKVRKLTPLANPEGTLLGMGFPRREKKYPVRTLANDLTILR